MWWRSVGNRKHLVGRGLSQRVVDRFHVNDASEVERREFRENLKAVFSRPWRSYAEVVVRIKSEWSEVRRKLPDINTMREWSDAERVKWNDYFRERESREWYIREAARRVKEIEQAETADNFWMAVEAAIRLGDLISELELKFETDWEGDAIRGRKIVDGAASTRMADDGVRKAYVDEILLERGKGLRDAFRVASSRKPRWGSECAFRQSYYKKPSNRGD